MPCTERVVVTGGVIIGIQLRQQAPFFEHGSGRTELCIPCIQIKLVAGRQAIFQRERLGDIAPSGGLILADHVDARDSHIGQREIRVEFDGVFEQLQRVRHMIARVSIEAQRVCAQCIEIRCRNLRQRNGAGFDGAERFAETHSQLLADFVQRRQNGTETDAFRRFGINRRLSARVDHFRRDAHAAADFRNARQNQSARAVADSDFAADGAIDARRVGIALHQCKRVADFEVRYHIDVARLFKTDAKSRLQRIVENVFAGLIRHVANDDPVALAESDRVGTA